MGNLRFDVVQEAFKKKAVVTETPAGKPSDYFGSLVFGRSNMRKYLDSKTYAQLTRCIDEGVPLDAATADKVAEGMKVWALEHGATQSPTGSSPSPRAPQKNTTPS